MYSWYKVRLIFNIYLLNMKKIFDKISLIYIYLKILLNVIIYIIYFNYINYFINE